MEKRVPFTAEQLKELIRDDPTPFYIYDEKGIRDTTRRLIAAFAWSPWFKQYYSVKVLPNPAILNITKDEGCGVDCSSLPELLLAERVGLSGEDVMFSSNDTPAEEYVKAKEKLTINNKEFLAKYD